MTGRRARCSTLQWRGACTCIRGPCDRRCVSFLSIILYLLCSPVMLLYLAGDPCRLPLALLPLLPRFQSSNSATLSPKP